MLGAYLSLQCGVRLGKPQEAVSKLINSGCKLKREINYRENQKKPKQELKAQISKQRRLTDGGVERNGTKISFLSFAYISELRLMTVWVSNHGYCSEANA